MTCLTSARCLRGESGRRDQSDFVLYTGLVDDIRWSDLCRLVGAERVGTVSQVTIGPSQVQDYDLF